MRIPRKCVDGFRCSECDLNYKIYKVDKKECYEQRKYIYEKHSALLSDNKDCAVTQSEIASPKPDKSGFAWQGKIAKSTTSNRPVLVDIRPVNFGLCVGSSDIVGIQSVTITPDMIGKKIGVMVCIEAKKEGWKYAGTEHEEKQKNFIEKIKSMGGIAFFASSAEGAVNTIKNWIFGV